MNSHAACPPALILCIGLLTTAGCSPSTPTAPITVLASPAAVDSGQPHLAKAADGTVVLSWLQHGGPTTELRFSRLQENEWQPARTAAHGSDWVVNWADVPSVVPIQRELWAAHWLERRPGRAAAYDVAVAVSNDAGTHWSEPVRPHDDDTDTEHGFVSLFPAGANIGVVWLDGRNLARGSDGPDPNGTSLRSAIVSPAAGIVQAALMDDLVCDCCQTDAAVTRDGPIVAYRNRTAAEIRDIYTTALRDTEWRPSTEVAGDNWEIAGCPVNGPAIDARGENVAVAWHTAAGTRRIQMAWSDDQGQSYTDPVTIDVGAVLGRVSIAMIDQRTAVVGWLRRGGSGDGEICVRTAAADGTLGTILVVARTDISRPSGFPQMVATGNRLVVAHTDISGTQPRVATLLVDLTAL